MKELNHVAVKRERSKFSDYPSTRFFQPDDKGTLNDGRRTGFSSKQFIPTSGRNDAVVLYTTASTKLMSISKITSGK